MPPRNEEPLLVKVQKGGKDKAQFIVQPKTKKRKYGNKEKEQEPGKGKGEKRTQRQKGTTKDPRPCPTKDRALMLAEDENRDMGLDLEDQATAETPQAQPDRALTSSIGPQPVKGFQATTNQPKGEEDPKAAPKNKGEPEGMGGATAFHETMLTTGTKKRTKRGKDKGKGAKGGAAPKKRKGEPDTSSEENDDKKAGKEMKK